MKAAEGKGPRLDERDTIDFIGDGPRASPVDLTPPDLESRQATKLGYVLRLL